MEQILIRIREERTRQDDKWGANRMMSDLMWQAVLTEEVGEAAKAILKGSLTLETEVLHVAAVAVAWLENMKRRGKYISPEVAWRERYFNRLLKYGLAPDDAAMHTAAAEVLLDIDPEDSADDEISTMREDGR
jgi:NTP pyrophosphatase (non-canonical NTP hydrolase)